MLNDEERKKAFAAFIHEFKALLQDDRTDHRDVMVELSRMVASGLLAFAHNDPDKAIKLLVQFATAATADIEVLAALARRTVN